MNILQIIGFLSIIFFVIYAVKTRNKYYKDYLEKHPNHTTR